MLRALIACLALLLAAAGDPPAKPGTTKANPAKTAAKQPMLKSASIDATGYPDTPAFDEQAEAQLLELANRDRAMAGLPALAIDQGLTQAARNHALAMAQAQQLSHQLAGEPVLTRRIAAVTDLRIDQAGENVALDMDIESAQDHLMASAPHRANLLDPSFNLAGFAVVRWDGRLYVVQDFVHRLSAYSLHQTETMVANALNRWRAQHGLAALTSTAPAGLRDAACGMAQTNTLGTKTIRELSQGHRVMTYTQSQPEVLPDGIDRILAMPQLKQVSVGICFGRSVSYPNGTYWVVVSSD
jgi:uncharacterized protein YkwD